MRAPDNQLIHELHVSHTGFLKIAVVFFERHNSSRWLLQKKSGKYRATAWRLKSDVPAIGIACIKRLCLYEKYLAKVSIAFAKIVF